MGMTIKETGECEFSAQVYFAYIFIKCVDLSYSFNLGSFNQNVPGVLKNASRHVENTNV